jgi:hypothetical protein
LKTKCAKERNIGEVERGVSRKDKKIVEGMGEKEEGPHTVFSDPHWLGWRT